MGFLLLLQRKTSAMTDMKEITVASALQLHKGSHIENDLLLLDALAALPLPEEPRRMGCLLLALCTSGTAPHTGGNNPTVGRPPKNNKTR